MPLIGSQEDANSAYYNEGFASERLANFTRLPSMVADTRSENEGGDMEACAPRVHRETQCRCRCRCRGASFLRAGRP